MVKAKVWNYMKPFEGWPKRTDVELVEEEMRPIEDGEFLAQAMFLSVDPFMRGLSEKFTIGEPIWGTQVAKIVESKNEEFPVGKLVVLRAGWRTYSISNGKKEPPTLPEPYLLPDIGDLCPSVALGVLGMPGNTAYFLFLELCQPKEGDTVVVTAAAGAIGSIVGQIGKIYGCNVIGIAGSNEKGEWLVKELGFDHFINYKVDDIDAKLKKLAPQGVDCFFDSVGGKTAEIIYSHMNNNGRVAQNGSISNYNKEKPDYSLSLSIQKAIQEKNLSAKTLGVYCRSKDWMTGINQLHTWVNEGKIKYKESIVDGIENMFDLFVDMLKGKTTGKAVIRA
ncbi:unnamed protein product [Diabrotica balteata]|uniref:Prostaglandin reductase 1 n=1 Tax=Diabrotica balteata TaxID=107213 RepID=A0A9N9XIY8_DIABA|nr:unnamed protein product [Diabrotica balteata]